jgi:hypothetical protein
MGKSMVYHKPVPQKIHQSLLLGLHGGRGAPKAGATSSLNFPTLPGAPPSTAFGTFPQARLSEGERLW